MSTPESADGAQRWLWVVAIVFSVVVLGLGVWVSVTTGQWLALLLAAGLTAPVDVMVMRRVRRRPLAG
ncbi:hypothetical protein [Mycetocola zhadangensis]|nr:hypothetical protein [Mycetocola zhadangensis]